MQPTVFGSTNVNPIQLTVFDLLEYETSQDCVQESIGTTGAKE